MREVLFEFLQGESERRAKHWIVTCVSALVKCGTIIAFQLGARDNASFAAVCRQRSEASSGQAKPIRCKKANATVVSDRVRQSGNIKALQQIMRGRPEMRVSWQFAEAHKFGVSPKTSINGFTDVIYERTRVGLSSIFNAVLIWKSAKWK